MKVIVLLFLYISLFASDWNIPLDANFRTHSSDTKITYSTRLNLIDFNRSKIITIIEQSYDTDGYDVKDKFWIKYIYYW